MQSVRQYVRETSQEAKVIRQIAFNNNAIGNVVLALRVLQNSKERNYK